MKFYRGYVASENKIPKEKFKDVPDEQLRTLESARNSGYNGYCGVLAPGVVLIDFDDEDTSKIALSIIRDKKLKCRVIKTTRGIHTLWKSNPNIYRGCWTHKQLAISLVADIKIGDKPSLEALKVNGEERKIIYDISSGEEYQEPPFIFWPMKYKQEQNVNFVGMASGDGRNQALFNYILSLGRIMDYDKMKETVIEINERVFSSPLPQSEIEVITRKETFKQNLAAQAANLCGNSSDYMGGGDGNKFQHANFGDFIIDKYHICKINGMIHIYQDGIYKAGREVVEKAMVDEIRELTTAKRNEVWNYIQLAVPQREMSTEDSVIYIAFRNGIYDIVNKKLVPFSPNYYVTNKIDWDYNPNAYSQLCNDLLDKMAGKDPDIRQIMEEVIGYTFYRRNELGKSIVMVGKGGTGKSTFEDLIRTMVGPKNVASLSISELGEKFTNAELANKLVNIGDDISTRYIEDTGAFKKLTTGEAMMIQEKGGKPVSFQNYAKLIFSSNNIPKMKDYGGEIRRRLLILPFDVPCGAGTPGYDPFIKYKLHTDEVMSYLINLGIAGLNRILYNHSFTTCKKVERKLDEYETDCNPILRFLLDKDIDKDVLGQIVSSVYTEYVAFCMDENLKQMSKAEFSRELRNRYGIVSTVAYRSGSTVRVYQKENKED